LRLTVLLGKHFVSDVLLLRLTVLQCEHFASDVLLGKDFASETINMQCLCQTQ